MKILSLLGQLPQLLKHFPDHNELASINEIQTKSQVLALVQCQVKYDK